MKKIFLIIFISLCITALFIAGWHFFSIFRIQKGALQITAAPESKVYLNDEYLGKTPLCKCEADQMISAGEYTLRLVPTNNEFSEFQEKITITPNVLTVVDRKFAKDSLSEGSVISLNPLEDKQKTALLITSLPEKATVFLDNNEIGQTPLLFPDPTESDHILVVRKNGYKEKTIRIRTPLGYKLTATVYLSASTAIDSLLPTPVASNSAEASASAKPTKPMVTILDTPTGFLRVRKEISGAEIAQVKPNESFALLEEKDGWFAIELKDKTIGWISAEYAKKDD